MLDAERKRRIIRRVFWISLIAIAILIYVVISQSRSQNRRAVDPARVQFLKRAPHTPRRNPPQNEEINVLKVLGDQVPLDKTSLDKVPVNQGSLDETSLNQVSLDKILSNSQKHVPIAMGETTEYFDGTKGPRFDYPQTSPQEYDDLQFMTIIPSLTTSQDLYSVRFLVGSLHMLRKGRNQVPTIRIFTATLLKDIPDEVIEEISWWNRARLHSIQEFLALPLTKLPESLIASSNTLRWSLIKQLLPETGHMIWIHHGMTFEPARIEIYRGEKAMNTTMLNQAYQLGRQVMMNLYAQLGEKGFLSANMPFKDLKYSNKLPLRTTETCLVSPGELVMEGYTLASLDYLNDRLDCALLKRNTACIKAEEHQSDIPLDPKDLGIYPIDQSSQASCMIEVREASFQSQLLGEVVSETPLTSSALRLQKHSSLSGKNIKRVALALPTTSKGMNDEELPIFLRVLLPSFLKTVTEDEWTETIFTIYIGFDHGDPMFELEEKRARYLKEAALQIADRPVQVKFLRLPNLRRVALLWNMLYLQALRDGTQYFYQINDDLTMVTSGWLTYFTSTLDSAGGFGVVGPADYHNALNCSILTQAMVTPVHFEIFGSLYPLELKDWKTDRWLTYIYQPDFMHCRGDIVANNGGSPTRYQHCEFLSYVIYVESAKRRLAEWLKEHPIPASIINDENSGKEDDNKKNTKNNVMDGHQ